ncbi:MAG: MOSC N-terminal beta barrel domain-containing protein [Candidatus Baltobacteraceae bacterium]
MELGTLASIWRYPVKSLHGESLAAAEVTPSGIVGDRESALVVTHGHTRLGKTYRGKESNLLHLVYDAKAALRAATERGVDVEVVNEDAHYFDDAPISIVIDRWLEGLSAHVGFTVEPERFRPNFFVRATPSFALDEASLTGREMVLGEIVLRARYPIERCVTTTYDQTTGASDPEILRYVAQNRSTWMGIYCDVLRAGTARIGDSLTLAER